MIPIGDKDSAPYKESEIDDFTKDPPNRNAVQVTREI